MCGRKEAPRDSLETPWENAALIMKVKQRRRCERPEVICATDQSPRASYLQRGRYFVVFEPFDILLYHTVLVFSILGLFFKCSDVSSDNLWLKTKMTHHVT